MPLRTTARRLMNYLVAMLNCVQQRIIHVRRSWSSLASIPNGSTPSKPPSSLNINLNHSLAYDHMEDTMLKDALENVKFNRVVAPEVRLRGSKIVKKDPLILQ